MSIAIAQSTVEPPPNHAPAAATLIAVAPLYGSLFLVAVVTACANAYDRGATESPKWPSLQQCRHQHQHQQHQQQQQLQRHQPQQHRNQPSFEPPLTHPHAAPQSHSTMLLQAAMCSLSGANGVAYLWGANWCYGGKRWLHCSFGSDMPWRYYCLRNSTRWWRL